MASRGKFYSMDQVMQQIGTLQLQAEERMVEYDKLKLELANTQKEKEILQEKYTALVESVQEERHEAVRMAQELEVVRREKKQSQVQHWLNATDDASHETATLAPATSAAPPPTSTGQAAADRPSLGGSLPMAEGASLAATSSLQGDPGGGDNNNNSPSMQGEGGGASASNPATVTSNLAAGIRSAGLADKATTVASGAAQVYGSSSNAGRPHGPAGKSGGPEATPGAGKGGSQSQGKVAGPGGAKKAPTQARQPAPPPRKGVGGKHAGGGVADGSDNNSNDDPLTDKARILQLQIALEEASVRLAAYEMVDGGGEAPGQGGRDARGAGGHDGGDDSIRAELDRARRKLSAQGRDIGLFMTGAKSVVAGLAMQAHSGLVQVERELKELGNGLCAEWGAAVREHREETGRVLADVGRLRAQVQGAQKELTVAVEQAAHEQRRKMAEGLARTLADKRVAMAQAKQAREQLKAATAKDKAQDKDIKQQQEMARSLAEARAAQQTAQQQAAALRTQLKQATELATNSEGTLQQLQAQCSALQKALDEERRRSSARERDLAQLQAATEEAVEELAVREEEIDREKRRLHDLAATMEASMERDAKEMAQLRAQLEKEHAVCQQLKHEVERLRAEGEQLGRARDAERDKAEQATAQLGEAQAALMLAEREGAVARDGERRQRDRVGALEAELATERAAREQEAAATGERDKQLAAKVQEVLRLERANADMAESFALAKASWVDKTVAFEIQASDASAAAREASAQLEAAKAARAEAVKAAKERAVKVAALEKELAARDGTVEELRGRVAELGAQVADLSQGMSKRSVAAETLKKKLAESEAALAELSATEAKRGTELADLRREKRRADERLGDAVKDRKALEEKLASVTADRKALDDKLAEAVKELQTANERAKVAEAEAEASRVQATGQVAALQVENQQQAATLKQQAAALTEQAVQADAFKGRVAQLEKELIREREACAAAARQAEDAESRARKALEDAARSVPAGTSTPATSSGPNEAQAELAALRGQVAEWRSLAEDREVAVRDLEVANKELGGRVGRLEAELQDSLDELVRMEEEAAAARVAGASADARARLAPSSSMSGTSGGQQQQQQQRQEQKDQQQPPWADTDASTLLRELQVRLQVASEEKGVALARVRTVESLLASAQERVEEAVARARAAERDKAAVEAVCQREKARVADLEQQAAEASKKNLSLNADNSITSADGRDRGILTGVSSGGISVSEATPRLQAEVKSLKQRLSDSETELQRLYEKVAVGERMAAEVRRQQKESDDAEAQARAAEAEARAEMSRQVARARAALAEREAALAKAVAEQRADRDRASDELASATRQHADAEARAADALGQVATLRGVIEEKDRWLKELRVQLAEKVASSQGPVQQLLLSPLPSPVSSLAVASFGALGGLAGPEGNEEDGASSATHDSSDPPSGGGDGRDAGAENKPGRFLNLGNGGEHSQGGMELLRSPGGSGAGGMGSGIRSPPRRAKSFSEVQKDREIEALSKRVLEREEEISRLQRDLADVMRSVASAGGGTAGSITTPGMGGGRAIGVDGNDWWASGGGPGSKHAPPGGAFYHHRPSPSTDQAGGAAPMGSWMETRNSASAAVSSRTGGGATSGALDPSMLFDGLSKDDVAKLRRRLRRVNKRFGLMVSSPALQAEPREMARDWGDKGGGGDPSCGSRDKDSTGAGGSAAAAGVSALADGAGGLGVSELLLAALAVVTALDRDDLILQQVTLSAFQPGGPTVAGRGGGPRIGTQGRYTGDWRGGGDASTEGGGAAEPSGGGGTSPGGGGRDVIAPGSPGQDGNGYGQRAVAPRWPSNLSNMRSRPESAPSSLNSPTAGDAHNMPPLRPQASSTVAGQRPPLAPPLVPPTVDAVPPTGLSSPARPLPRQQKILRAR
eukprot:jgi/Mesvir1/26517/Mv16174-RA.1